MSFNPQAETSNIFRMLAARRKTILAISLSAAVFGLALGLFKTKRYSAETTFILKNHLFADRTYLYSKDMRYINYYAPEDDIERLIALTDADHVLDELIGQLDLVAYYKTDTAKPKALRILKKKIAKQVEIMRTPEKHAILSYEDKNPEMAARIANKYLELIELNLRINYNSVRADVYRALQNKIAEEDSALLLLTDSLASMRKYYGIYDIISPTRGNMIVNAHIQDNGHPEFAKGLELIQNVESVKDRAVADRSDHISLANQYAGSEKIGDLSLIQIVKVAQPPLKASSTGPALIALVSFVAGLIFSVLYLLVQARIAKKTA
ncbi:MAG TPA: hypothetical protein VL092_03195 [Chitinophagaceae bacterium]|nr:hypothetical protein [Chitinophagaceae bacterium]